jgi:hypothetical protein
MANKLPITKRLKDEIFVWDPTAFQSKGYWYILGKTGAYGRPASSAEKIKLGSPSKAETSPVSPKVAFMDTPQLSQGGGRRRYRKRVKLAGQQDFRTGPLKEIIFQKWFNEGTPISEAIKQALSEKFKAKVATIKDKFDPLNMITKLVGDKAGAIIGRKMGRSEEDISRFTGYGDTTGARDSKLKALKGGKGIPDLEKATYSSISEGQQKRMNKGSGLADVLARTYNILKKSYDEENKKSKGGSKLNDQKNKWNKELVEAITANKMENDKVTIKEFDSYKKIINKKFKEIEELLGDGGKSILGSIAEGMTLKTLATTAGRLALASPFLIPIAALVGGIASQQAIKEDIESNPNDAKYDNNPYANSIRDKSSLDAAAQKLSGRARKGMPYNDVVELLKLPDKAQIEDETGKSVPEIQKWVQENTPTKKNPMPVMPVIPKAERLKAQAKQTGETAVAVPAVAEKPVETAVKAIANVNEKVISNAPASSQSNTPTAKSVPTANESPALKDEKPALDSLSDTRAVSNVPAENNTGSEVAAATQLNQDLSSTNNSGAIVADNSQKITIVNQNNDGLLVEELTGVRLDESTFKKVARQNLHMI